MGVTSACLPLLFFCIRCTLKTLPTSYPGTADRCVSKFMDARDRFLPPPYYFYSLPAASCISTLYA